MFNYEKEIADQRFGKLTAIRFMYRKSYRTYWLFKCDCGKDKVANINDVKRGAIKSCGCLQVENCTKVGKKTGAINGSIRFKEEAGLNVVYYRYKRRAKKSNLVFDIDKKTFKNLISLDCFYCGGNHSNIFKRKSGEHSFTYNGIDRVDSNKGYSPDNVVPCCEMCNRMKMIYSKEDFLNQIKKIHAHMKLGS